MKTAEFMRKVHDYGGDVVGIRERFMGNDELYMSCFTVLFEEPSIEQLRQAMHNGDCGEAFFAAHAIKGLAGNLGITPFYEAVCELVESLRAENFEKAKDDYISVCEQWHILTEIAP